MSSGREWSSEVIVWSGLDLDGLFTAIASYYERQFYSPFSTLQ